MTLRRTPDDGILNETRLDARQAQTKLNSKTKRTKKIPERDDDGGARERSEE